MVKNNKGHIVEIASMSSFVGVGVFSDYSATKTALISFVESESLIDSKRISADDTGLREQLRGWYGSPDVHVTIVHPLFVETAMTSYRKAAIEKATGKMLSAPAVGRQIADQIFACKGEQMVIPDTHSILRTTRAWPGWLLAAFKDLTSPAKLSKVE
jgi:all-trans-retinol dehydrogenase (NAD+)